MGQLRVEFYGGFAWLFDGTASGAMGGVALVKALAGSAFQHRLELRVAGDARITHTSSTGHRRSDGGHVFTPKGRLTLTCDGAATRPGPLARVVSATPDGSTNSFYHVFNVGRIKGQAEQRASRADNVVMRLDLPEGRLDVSGEYRHYWRFKDGNHTRHGEDRYLATKIVWFAAQSPAQEVAVEWDGGRVVLDASSDLTLQCWATCDCGGRDLEVGDAAPGFFESYGLYDQVDITDRLIPVRQVDPRPESGAVSQDRRDGVPPDAVVLTPGPDCPPTEHLV